MTGTSLGSPPGSRREPSPAGGVANVIRETFASRAGAIITLIGVALGLGNVWRFPYMVGRYGGAAFVLFYLLVVLVIGIPGLMAEWALGRHTRRGTVGAFARAGLPGGRFAGWFFFVIVIAATAYYTNVIGWVLYYAIAELVRAAGGVIDASRVLPPDTGIALQSLGLQLVCTAAVTLSCVYVLLRGLRRGIERASRIVIPLLCLILGVLIVRALTLPNALAGLEWYILKFELSDLTPRVMMAAIGHAVFSLSLGGTFMVVYGSYLRDEDSLTANAGWTTFGDTVSGLLAGLAIFPAVFALGLEPNSGPGLIFATLPQVFAAIPLGWVFGLLFFVGLLGAGYLSGLAAFEVLVAGLTDNTGLGRRKSVWLIAAIVFFVAIPPMLNNRVFVPWDLTFGSGMQTLGALVAAVTVGWAMQRSEAIRALSAGGARPVPTWLYHWIRWVIPGALLLVGAWWLLTEAL
ncbi:MAG TPA: sodium-dependent transporter [Gemmatimonadaceae bacterium]|nr:sodium-dependent transporter [Gemmatimonadaceae bacterium]